MLDPVECPEEWIQAYMAKTRYPLAGGKSSGHFREDTRRPTDSHVWELTRKQAASFRLPAIQAKVSGWWEAPCSIHSLNRRDFLPYSNFCGMRDLRKTWQEETLVLAQALQHCRERSGVPSGVLCNVAHDLQRCTPHAPPGR